MITALFRSIPIRLGASLALTGAIAFLSLVPGYPQEGDAKLVVMIGSVPSLLQNAMHVALYALLTVLWAAALVRFKRPILLAALFATGYGALLEFAQLFASGRYASLFDIGLNTAGVLIGVAVAASLTT
ncbi:VanZ family protein [Halochromatium salexigens]|uniref:VanZ-like domain-containing protein n=1 Tax=Halochromatium salexigens TaxID=49447 RepID=A0AAJ0UCR5_HALSE|nr:VanZ family protein [Halochromatium salexigens]MBK5929133.1 hypothetical protein [Halochromatium salexigens]